MTDCPLIEQLQKLLDEALPQEERLRIEAHIEQCATCREVLERLTESASRSWLSAFASNQLDVTDATAAASHYRLLRLHKKGGLGEVYEARDELLHRPVAVKFLQHGNLSDPDSQQRFRAEAEVTATLDHPGIVAIHALAADSNGRPGYVMRFVQGETLHEAIEKYHQTHGPLYHLVEAKLGLRSLLGRFVAVCNTVAYAHSRGVLHRDLKPANIMLGPFGETLVLDWGMGKRFRAGDPVGQEGNEEVLSDSQSVLSGTIMSRTGGTPGFMGPEQAAGSGMGVGQASDVYGLGATLYCLLTGKVPAPSPGVCAGRDAASNASHRNGFLPPRAVNPKAPAPLEAICLKAMAQRPTDRYASALELAADVEQWLADEPISVYREPWLVRAGRWRRRHPQLVTASVALMLAGVALSLLVAVNRDQARRQAERLERDIREQKDIAETQREVAEAKEKTANEREAETRAVLDFVEKKVFAAARPTNQAGGLGYDVQLADALKAALPFVETGFKHQPLIEARLRMTLGQSFLFLGKAKVGAEQYQAARTIFTEHLGPDHPDTLRSMSRLANSYYDLGWHAKALELNEETLALVKAKLGIDHPDTLLSMNNLANSYDAVGRRADALKLYEDTLALRKAKFGPDHPDTLSSMNNLAVIYKDLGRHAEALELQEKTLVLRKAKLGPDHPDTLGSMNNLAAIYTAVGRRAEALKLDEETLALYKAKLGPGHPDTLRSMSNLAASYAELGRYVDALKLCEETLMLQGAKLGPDHPLTLITIYNIACIQAQLIPKSKDRVMQADLAMDWLKKAVDGGYKDIAQIKTDADLDALRGREDFKKLLAELEKKVQKVTE
jgi:eukaryotic-like serine/threonine-protein kinase